MPLAAGYLFSEAVNFIDFFYVNLATCINSKKLPAKIIVLIVIYVFIFLFLIFNIFECFYKVRI